MDTSPEGPERGAGEETRETANDERNGPKGGPMRTLGPPDPGADAAGSSIIRARGAYAPTRRKGKTGDRS